MPKTISPVNAVRIPTARPASGKLAVSEAPFSGPSTGGPGPLPETVSKGSEKPQAKNNPPLSSLTGGSGALPYAAIVAGVGLAYLLFARK